MAIVRWDPFEAFLGAQQDLSRMFRGSWPKNPNDVSGLAEGGKWAPAVDIYETGEALVVEAELPGMDPHEIEITVDEGILTVKGERKHDSVVNDENYYRVERAWGSFQRSIRLPAEAEQDMVKASYEAGVLKITVPKAEPLEPKSIAVTVETPVEKKQV